MDNIPKFLDIPTKEGEPPTPTFTEIDFIAVSHNQNWDMDFHDDMNGASKMTTLLVPLMLPKCREPEFKLQTEHAKHPELLRPQKMELTKLGLFKNHSLRVEWSTTPTFFTPSVRNHDSCFVCLLGPAQRRKQDHRAAKETLQHVSCPQHCCSTLQGHVTTLQWQEDYKIKIDADGNMHCIVKKKQQVKKS